MGDLIERLRAFVVERGKLSCGSDIVSACNNSALRLTDLRAILDALEAAREDAWRLAEALVFVLPFAEHSERCGDIGAYNGADIPDCGCGLDSVIANADAAIDAAMAAEGRDG